MNETELIEHIIDKTDRDEIKWSGQPNGSYKSIPMLQRDLLLFTPTLKIVNAYDESIYLGNDDNWNLQNAVERQQSRRRDKRLNNILVL